MNIKIIKQQAKGRWDAILSAKGVPSHLLRGKNCACPVCGGNDRFRWDNKNGDGGGYCHQCDFKGSGLTLLAKWLNMTRGEDFPKLLKTVAEYLGSHSYSFVNQNKSTAAKNEDNTSGALKIWDESEALAKNLKSSAVLYLQNRGLNSFTDITTLRFHKALRFEENNTYYPALVAKVTDVENNQIGIHRIFLDSAGNKAPVEKPKKALGKIKSGAIRFDDDRFHAKCTTQFHQSVPVDFM